MLLQTNSYIVPKEKRSEHARLMRQFRQVMLRLGCEYFEVYEQTTTNWGLGGPTSGRFVQILKFRDRQHFLAVQHAERNDPPAQTLIKEFCALLDLPSQQEQGLFASGFYTSVLPVGPARSPAVDVEPVEVAQPAPTTNDAPAPETTGPVPPPSPTSPSAGAGIPITPKIQL